MITTDDGSVVLEPDETVIYAYAGVVGGEARVFSPEEALDFMRKEIYTTTRSPYLRKWQYTIDEGEWFQLEEEWEVVDE
jgi:hypothetical protein